MAPRSEFFAGLRSQLPILAGVIPFGVIYGVVGVGAGLLPVPAQAMSSIVFAGSSQFVAVQMIREQAPGLIIVLTTLVVNLRHSLYAASVQPYLKSLPARWKWLLAYLLTDEAYATTITHYQAPGAVTYKHWFYLGAGLTLWATWQLSTAAGVLFGASALIPAAWSLDFALAVTFIGLVVPAVKDRASLAAALSAGLLAVAGAGLPYKLGLMIAAVAGILAGLAARPRTKAEPA